MPPRTWKITTLEWCHYFCRAIPLSQGARRAVEIMREQGSTILWWGKPLTVFKPYTEPEGILSEDGSIILGPELHHRLLVPEHQTSAEAPAAGKFAFFADTPAVTVSQNADFVDSPPADLLATGLLALACHVYPALRPGYGWVDESGWNLPEGRARAAHRPRYLFWATFYGPEYAKDVGREFLLAAPCWRVVDLGDGGLLHVATESYSDWWQNDQTALLGYFRQKFPKVQLYRAQPIPY